MLPISEGDQDMWQGCPTIKVKLEIEDQQDLPVSTENCTNHNFLIKDELSDYRQVHEYQPRLDKLNDNGNNIKPVAIKQEPFEDYLEDIVDFHTDIKIEDHEFEYHPDEGSALENFSQDQIKTKTWSSDKPDKPTVNSDPKAKKRRNNKGSSGPWICSVCGKKEKSKFFLDRHEETHYRTGPLEKVHPCQQCDKSFAKMHNLKMHEMVHSGVKPFSCTHCDKGFTRALRLQDHLRLVHHITRTGDEEKPAYSDVINFYPKDNLACPLCPKDQGFKMLEEFTEHVLAKYYHADKPMKCPLCPASAITNGYDLLDHIFECHMDCKLSCGNCDYKVFRLSEMQSHLNNAHRTLRKLCDICGQWFNKLLDHKQLHLMKKSESGPKFSCPTCDKAFHQKQNLVAHLRVHTNERPYKCPFCDKAFKQSSYLKAHKAIHTKEKPFGCNQCDEVFNRHEVLLKHRISEHGFKPAKRGCYKVAHIGG